MSEETDIRRIRASTEELERRRKAVRGAMKEKGLDALVFLVPGNIRWLTDRSEVWRQSRRDVCF